MDGLTQCEVRKQLEEKEACEEDLIPLIGKSGQAWGMVRVVNISSNGDTFHLDPVIVFIYHLCSAFLFSTMAFPNKLITIN